MTLKPPKVLLVTYKHNKGVKKGMMQKKGWWILVIVSVGIMIPFMIPYLTLNPANSRVDINSTTQYSILVTHIGCAFYCLNNRFSSVYGSYSFEKSKGSSLCGEDLCCQCFH